MGDIRHEKKKKMGKMMTDWTSREFGPWIEFSGAYRPVPEGTIVMVENWDNIWLPHSGAEDEIYYCEGRIMILRAVAPIAGWRYVGRYAVLKDRGFEQISEILKRLPVPETSKLENV